MKKIKLSRKQKATLRVCASCEWIYKKDERSSDCPRCGFSSYAARHVYGDKCYHYFKTQKPWLEKELFRYEMELRREIPEIKKTPKRTFKDLRRIV